MSNYFQSKNKTAADNSAVGPVAHRGEAELLVVLGAAPDEVEPGPDAVTLLP